VQELIEIRRSVTGASRRMRSPIRLRHHFMKRQRPQGLWRFRFARTLFGYVERRSLVSGRQRFIVSCFQE
jgi:hypothetical protein